MIEYLDNRIEVDGCRFSPGKVRRILSKKNGVIVGGHTVFKYVISSGVLIATPYKARRWCLWYPSHCKTTWRTHRINLDKVRKWLKQASR